MLARVAPSAARRVSATCLFSAVREETASATTVTPKSVRQEVHGGLVDADVGLDPAEHDMLAIQCVELSVERFVTGATETGLVDRLLAAQQLSDLGQGRPQGLRHLLTPEDGDIEGLGGLDEGLDVLEEEVFAGHQLGQLALDVNDDETTLGGVEHSVAFKMPPGRNRAPPCASTGQRVLRRTIVKLAFISPSGGAGITLVAGSFEASLGIGISNDGSPTSRLVSVITWMSRPGIA